MGRRAGWVPWVIFVVAVFVAVATGGFGWAVVRG